jgi:5-methylcytosine-specific restriction endonuclease McrA
MLTKAQQLRKNKPDVRKLKKKLMDLAKKVVKQRDKNICQKCGKYVEGSNCHASHVIPVSAGHMLAFDPINMKILCFFCHLRWWHKNPLESADWFTAKFPERRAYLEERKKIKKWTAYELELEIEKIKKTLQN